MKPSGIGGQAVIEGIMMRNKDVYSVAVRKPDNEIEVMKKESKLLTEKHEWLNFPIIRGIFNFIDSLVLGMSTITYSASFYDEEPREMEPTPIDSAAKAVFKDKLDSILMAVTVLFSIAFAVVLFMLTPYFVSRLLSKIIVSKGALNLIEGLIRVAIFIGYILAISIMKDIKRVFMYHGAEHKCINCIENGLELNVDNVRISSRHHKRCGTSFLFFVMFVSIVFFIFISVDNPFWQIIIRLLLVPVIAGVSYELIRWAGRSESAFVNTISKPGMWLQSLTTREPDDDMIEVGIRAVEAVFDWKTFLKEYYDEIDINEIHKDNVNSTETTGTAGTTGTSDTPEAIQVSSSEDVSKQSVEKGPKTGTFKSVVEEMAATQEADATQEIDGTQEVDETQDIDETQKTVVTQELDAVESETMPEGIEMIEDDEEEIDKKKFIEEEKPSSKKSKKDKKSKVKDSEQSEEASNLTAKQGK